jgi:circadian clock protein KaiC
MTSATGDKLTSGTPGLDEVLHGGFLAGQTAILSGGPGTGKTILALQFLAAGGDGLYVGFEERERQIRHNAEALGIDLSTVSVLDLSAPSDRFFANDSYTVFPSEEVEGEDVLERIGDALESTDVDRLVIDPLSELRSLLPDDYQFRRNISSLFNDLADRGVTTLCTAQPDDEVTASDLQFLGNTTIEITRETDRRTLEVTKYRGSDSASGAHTLRIHSSGAQVYPKLVPGDHHQSGERTPLPSDVTNLDRLLDGGIERGSVTVISGPSGVGKTTTASYFLQAAASRGERARAYLFEELRPDYLYRSTQLGMNVESLVADGMAEVEEVESLTLTSDEFAYDARQAVEERDVSFVMIDGTSGYRQALRGDDSPDALTRELHALCRYLKRMGVTVILIEEVGTLTGEFSPTVNQISYLADNIVFLRYLEIDGELQKAIGVLKKRYGDFETALRELSIDTDGLTVGDQLKGYRGLLTGIAESIDDSR